MLKNKKYVEKRIKRHIIERELERWMSEDIDEDDMRELEELEAEEERAKYHQFSPEFEAKMEALFAEARKREAERIEAGLPVLTPPSTPDGVVEWKYVDPMSGEVLDKVVEEPVMQKKRMSKALRNGLAVAAAVVLVFAVGAVQSIRSGAVFGIEMEVFREIYDNFVSVTWGSNEKEAGKVVVLEPELSVLPEGYVEDTRIITDNMYVIKYNRDGNKTIIISGGTIASGTISQFDGDRIVNQKFIDISGVKCKMGKTTEDELCIEWEMDGNLYLIDAPIYEKDILKIIENMVK